MEISVNYSQKYMNQPMPMLVVLTTTMKSSSSNEKRPTRECHLHYTEKDRFECWKGNSILPQYYAYVFTAEVYGYFYAYVFTAEVYGYLLKLAIISN